MHILRARLVPLTLAGATLLMTFTSAAVASRAPSSQARTAVATAVHESSVGGLNRIPSSHYRVTGIRISSVSSSWASAQLTPAPGYQTSFQSGMVVAVRPAGTMRWVVVDVGSAQVGCGIAPDKVLADLDGVGRPCATGGIS